MSAGAAMRVIAHNGQLSRVRGLVDLIVHQKTDQALISAINKVYEISRGPIALSSYVSNFGEERIAILKVLNNQEFIAAGIRVGAFNEAVYKEMQFSNVRKLYEVAAGFISDMRAAEKNETIFQDFEGLALRWGREPLKKIRA